MMFADLADAPLWPAIASVIVGICVLIGQVITTRRSGAVKKAINGELHDRLDAIDGKLDALVGEIVREKVRAQLAEAELSARTERLEHP